MSHIFAEYIFSKATYIKKKPTCYLYYVTTGKWVGDKNCVGRMQIVKDDLLAQNIFEDVIFVIESKRENRSDIEAFKAI